MTARCKLSEIAKTIRSKNAGVDKITFDILYESYLLSILYEPYLLSILYESYLLSILYEPYLLSILKFTRAGNSPAILFALVMVRNQRFECRRREERLGARDRSL
jgi:pilus assembly protein TadC